MPKNCCYLFIAFKIIFCVLLVGFSNAKDLISYKTLASENTVPFVFHGSGTKKEKYISAVQKWPDVRSCLIKNERKKNNPDIRLINWSGIDRVEDADVCMFRIFTSIETVEGTLEWLKYHGFRIGRRLDRFRFIRPLHGKEKKKINTFSYSGGILLRWGKGKVKFPALSLMTLWLNVVANSQTVQVTWTEEGEILFVRNSFNFK